MQIPIYTRQADSTSVLMETQCTWQLGLDGHPVQICFERMAPPHVTTAQDRITDFANAYWIYGLILLLWMVLCLIVRSHGETDLTVNHYETYEGYELNNPSEDDDE